MTDLAVIFDLDGVVVDNASYHIRAWKTMAEKYGFAVTEDEIKSELFGKFNNEIIEYLLKRKPTKEEIKKYADEKETLYREFIRPEIRPLAGLPEFLGELKQNNVKIALATAAPDENVEFILGKTGLTDYFPVIVNENDVEHGKPDPEIFLKSAEAIGAAPEDCIVFEDSVHGVEAGKRAGMKVVGVATTNPPEKLSAADLVIRDFREVGLGRLKQRLSPNYP